MIIADTNVLLYLAIEGEHTAAASHLYQSDSDWLAPTLWREEFINALCLYERVEGVPREMSLARIRVAEETLSQVLSIATERVLETAARTGCSGYDSQFVALAEDLEVPLYTFDNRILAAVPELAKRPSAP